MHRPLRVGIIGMGGFAGAHHSAVLELERAGECRLVCTCDPQLSLFAGRQQELDFGDRCVRVFADYAEMLDQCGDGLDAVTIPTPVPLHPAMHRACVERGIAAYLEKPPTLDYAVLQRMLDVEARALFLTGVGFNYIVEPERRALKRRLLSGEFGPVRKVSLCYLIPRSSSYFARAPWAGRLMLEGQLVLDSCLGNAMAHQAHDGLFWCGQGGLWSWGEVGHVRAELYRGHSIEGADTVFLKATSPDGPTLLLAMSHAWAGSPVAEQVVQCELADIRYTLEPPDGGQVARFVVHWRNGDEEVTQTTTPSYLEANLRAYFDYLRGRAERPLTRLADTVPFVHLNDLAYIASGRIVTVHEEGISRERGPGDKNSYAAIAGLDGIARCFVESDRFPSEQGVPWGVRGGSASPADLPRLTSVIQRMLTDRWSTR